MVDVISDIKGTLTNFKKQVGVEKAYFYENAVKTLMEIEDINEEEARAKYDEIIQHDDKKDPLYKKVFAVAVNKVAEQGYRNSELSLEGSIKEGVGDFFEAVHQDGGRIILVGLAQPEGTRASLATVGLDVYADSVYASADVGSKVDGTAFRTIAEREGNLDLSKCLYLDDKLDQAEGAVKVGMGKAVWVLDGKEKTETEIDAIKDFREVKRFYDQLKQEIE